MNKTLFITGVLLSISYGIAFVIKFFTKGVELMDYIAPVYFFLSFTVMAIYRGNK